MTHEQQPDNKNKFQNEELHLESSYPDAPEHDASLQARLRIIDQLLSTAAMLGPGIDLAERVLKAIEEQEHRLNRQAGTGLALGLTVLIAMALALIASLGIGILVVLLNWTTTYQTIVFSGGQAAATISAFAGFLQQTMSTSPYATELAAFSVPLAALWVWIMRKVSASGTVSS